MSILKLEILLKCKSLSLYHLLLLILFMFLGQANISASERSLIRQQLEAFQYDRLIMGQSDIAAAELIVDFYRGNGYERVWTNESLVELLMKDPTKWNQTSIAEIVHSGQLRNVILPQTVPLLLLYFTAEMEDNGQVLFYKDVYKRDQKVIQGLKQPFNLDLYERKMVHNSLK